ncbi:hypothetical protein VCRA2128O305_210009 [Vibrio crassostreae]|nr:hypothetical protein VCRA2112O187_1500001 [Vibrio crassostreae]CAK1800342.1 hypothetical protein VCRA2113O207_190008 [Vibrio crassostreae]CAK1899575.1 hypothetical protein VCRA2110O173_220008 [Vibrio crassostreae]CAK1907163.1 hypothetical protein VCRA2112O192_210008 [Vibrio crassostreae]CAK1928581.1 hypothetical protein VCRA2110O182_220053 [Vibrio crassostreae]
MVRGELDLYLLVRQNLRGRECKWLENWHLCILPTTGDHITPRGALAKA